MRVKDLTPELLERAKKCETEEERLAFIQENEIELTEEELDGMAGGFAGPFGGERAGRRFGPKIPSSICKKAPDKKHRYVETGAKRDGWLWEIKERKCQLCGVTYWL